MVCCLRSMQKWFHYISSASNVMDFRVFSDSIILMQAVLVRISTHTKALLLIHQTQSRVIIRCHLKSFSQLKGLMVHDKETTWLYSLSTPFSPLPLPYMITIYTQYMSHFLSLQSIWSLVSTVKVSSLHRIYLKNKWISQKIKAIFTKSRKLGQYVSSLKFSTK